MDIETVKYRSEYKSLWNSFVSLSKNGTFIFYRDYMDYHADRFVDNSLLFFYNHKLIALLPAHRVNDCLYSHNGLTYGSLILSAYAKINHVIVVFEEIKKYMLVSGISSLEYKTIPYIYHSIPSQEDLYSLYTNNAILTKRKVSSCLYLDRDVEFSTQRKRGLRKSENYNLSISEDVDFASFWKILEDNLSDRYTTSPVHNLSEITSLKSKFPDNIKLYNISIDSNIIGGCVIYFSSKVAHVQYIASNSFARSIGALDCLFSYIISVLYNKGLCLDFGTSMLEDNYSLNKGLISQKEGFGARSIVYDTYLLTINN